MTIEDHQIKRRLTMVTRDRPPPGVEPFAEGFVGGTTNTTTGRVVNGVCGHGHVEVLMGG